MLSADLIPIQALPTPKKLEGRRDTRSPDRQKWRAIEVSDVRERVAFPPENFPRGLTSFLFSYET